jgi:hypothetical protein
MAVMGVATLVTGVVSSRIGPKRTLGIVGWRALWSLGKALFIATALATIVNSARGSVAQAITLYEAALGLGRAERPGETSRSSAAWHRRPTASSVSRAAQSPPGSQACWARRQLTSAHIAVIDNTFLSVSK